MVTFGSRAALLGLALVAVLVATLSPGPATPSADVAPVSSRTSCHGISYAQVLGHRPGYGRHYLRPYAARRYTCRAYWLPSVDAQFVPQALALDGSTAWVSGYRQVPKVGNRACRLVQISLRTGRVLHNKARITGRVGRSPLTFCRHGGGLARSGHELWLAERDRLWLIDTRNRHTLRVWRIHRPVYGSSVVLHQGRVGLMQFRKGGRQGRLHWFSRSALMRRGVVDIVGQHPNGHSVAPTGARRVPPYAQGGGWWSGHGLIRTRSWRGCGQMVLPGGRTVGVMQGIEDAQMAPHGRVWVVSEASARPYQHKGRGMVPMLSEYSAPRVFGMRKYGYCP